MDIEEVDFRVNDEKVKEDQLSRDAFTDLTIKRVGSSNKGDKIGLSQVLRLSLDNIAIDSDDDEKG